MIIVKAVVAQVSDGVPGLLLTSFFTIVGLKSYLKLA